MHRKLSRLSAVLAGVAVALLCAFTLNPPVRASIPLRATNPEGVAVANVKQAVASARAEVRVVPRAEVAPGARHLDAAPRAAECDPLAAVEGVHAGRSTEEAARPVGAQVNRVDVARGAAVSAGDLLTFRGAPLRSTAATARTELSAGGFGGPDEYDAPAAGAGERDRHLGVLSAENIRLCFSGARVPKLAGRPLIRRL